MSFRNDSKRKTRTQLALSAGLVVAFAGCQVAPSVVPGEQVGGLGGRTATVPGAKPGEAGAAQQAGDKAGAAQGATSGAAAGAAQGSGAAAGGAPQVKPDAKVTGLVRDINGKPIPNITVNTYNGFKTVTDGNGRFSLDVKAQDNLRLDLSAPGYLFRQVNVSVVSGEVALANAVLKPVDEKVTRVTAAAGATVVSSDGRSELIIPPGALTKDGDVRLTWMDPMPSDNFPFAYGELPGPLVSRTLPSGERVGPDDEVSIPPIAFTAVDVLGGGRLAPGAAATLRMRVNPEALKLAGENIDFNRPETLLQPCYDFDRGRGLWVDPASSKIEKAADGTVWFVYQMQGAGNTPNFYNLLQTVSTGSHVTGTQLVQWNESENYQVWQPRPGGGGSWVTRTRTVTRSRWDNLYGKNFSGTVRESSANGSLNGQPLANARVRHQADFYGSTTKTTNAAGGFTIPMWHNTNSVSVNGVDYYNATAPGGWDVNLGTNSTVTLQASGDDFNSQFYNEDFTVTYKVDGQTKTETVKLAPTRQFAFGRDTSDNTNNFELIDVESANFFWLHGEEKPTNNLLPGDAVTHSLALQLKLPK